jgi:hypothetical protein
MGGAAFARSIKRLSLHEREAAILREITAGNLPDFLRGLKRVDLSAKAVNGRDVAATIFVMPDYLAVGNDTDFIRMPMTPQTAQRIADRFGCVLPTRKVVDAIDAAAVVRLAPQPLISEREAVPTFLEHHQLIESQRVGKALGLLVTGIKKDIVLSPRVFERPNRLALYGWRKLDGQPIQPLTTVHTNRYVDYSHGVRLVSNTIEYDGERRKLTELLVDPDLCSIVSDEGPLESPRYALEYHSGSHD